MCCVRLRFAIVIVLLLLESWKASTREGGEQTGERDDGNVIVIVTETRDELLITSVG